MLLKTLASPCEPAHVNCVSSCVCSERAETLFITAAGHLVILCSVISYLKSIFDFVLLLHPRIGETTISLVRHKDVN